MPVDTTDKLNKRNHRVSNRSTNLKQNDVEIYISKIVRVLDRKI